MVLSRLTKITGPGVATDTNWVGNNADFTGITTTATSFNIGVTTIHSTLIESHNIVSTGVITATGGSFSGNVTAVDGTFTGNVSIAGTLTYEDVTNIDSVGIITAPALDVDDFLDVGSSIKLGNAGVITATSFVGSGAALTGIDATAIKDSGGNVKIQAQASGAIHTGVSTFQDIDVDGHTNLDNVSIAGVTTFTDNVRIDADNKKLQIGDNQYLELYDSGSYRFIQAQGTLFIDATGDINFRDPNTGEYRAAFNNNGSVQLFYDNSQKLGTAGWGVQINGILKVLDSTDSSGATNHLTIGTGSDLKLYHDGNQSYLKDYSNQLNIIAENAIKFTTLSGSETYAKFIHNGAVELYHDNVKTFETTGKGIQVGTGATIETNGQATYVGIVTASQGLRVPNGSATTNYISVGDNGALRFWGTGHQYADIRAGNLHFRNASLQNVLEIQQDKEVYFYGNAYLQNARFDQTVTINDTITHHGDTDTKIRFPAADTVSIETAGSERLRITSTGKLGINAASPVGNLQVMDTSSNVPLIRIETSDGGNKRLDLKVESSDGVISCEQSAQELHLKSTSNTTFSTNSSERLRIDSNGTVLHGTGAVATQKATNGGLDVACNGHSIVFGADSNSGNPSQARTNNATKDMRISAVHYTNAEEPIGIVRVTSDSTTNVLNFGGGSSILNAATTIGFYTAANKTTTNGTERLRINSSGIIETGTSIGNGGDANLRLRVGRSGDCFVGIRNTSGTGQTGLKLGDSANESAGQLYYDHDDNSMRIHCDGDSVPRFRINSWGGLSAVNTQYSGNDKSYAYYFSFHKSGTYNTFNIEIGFNNPGGYNLEMLMGGYSDRQMHTTFQGYVYDGNHYGSVGAIDSGSGPQRSFSTMTSYGSYGTKMRFQFTSMSSTHTVVEMRLTYGPAGGVAEADITNVSWS